MKFILQDFLKYAIKFDSVINALNKLYPSNLYDRRDFSSVNDRLMSIEKCFLQLHFISTFYNTVKPRGIPNDPTQRHLLFSVSNKNNYEHSIVMSTVHDAVCFFSIIN